MKLIPVFIFLSFVTTGLFAQTNNVESMQSAVKRLKQATESKDNRAYASALCEIASLDLASVLDSEAFAYASKAEEISRKYNYPEFLSRSLIIKSNVCACAETDSLFNRNDEGLGYALEALKAAEKAGSAHLESESCCCLCQLYINKNRWNSTLNEEWYRQAGDYLNRAEQSAPSDSTSNPAKFLAIRMRYYRQGSQVEKAIEYCENAYEKCDKDNYLMISQIFDHLTPLYIMSDRYEEAAQSHSAYVHYSTLWSRMSEAEKLQEITGKYNMELKQAIIEKKTYMILFLTVLSILLSACAVLLYARSRKEKLRRIEAEKDSIAKQELIEFISKDFNNPLNSGRKELERFVATATKLKETEIADEAKKLIEENHHLSGEVSEYISNLIINKKKSISDARLSEREIEIIRLCADGLTAAQIAERLFISTRTVSNHKSNIFSKLGVNTNTEMCKLARNMGLI